MVNYLKWMWQRSDAWHKRNYVWFLLLFLSFFTPYLLFTLVVGIVLVSDSIICAVVESYQSYKNEKNQKK